MKLTLENIRLQRAAKNYTQSYMALQLKISQRGYCKIETGKTKLTVERLKQIAFILEVELSLLLGE